MEEGLYQIEKKLAAFRRKYYVNLFVKGALLTSSFVLVYFLLASFIEYNLWLSGTARFLIFTLFFILVAFCIYRFLKAPLTWWIYKRGLGQEESARMIGSFFPTISDRLLNVIQLAHNPSATPLVKAGIVQKSRQFENVSFESAIRIGENKRYLKYLLVPVAVIAVVWIINNQIFTQSTKRIVQFNREFSPEAPFQFLIGNKNLTAFFNEDFTLQVNLNGKVIPEDVYINTGDQRYKMQAAANGGFSYTFEKLQQPVDFQLEASGFYSDPSKIAMVNRPELTGLSVSLAFPKYLKRKSEELFNAANLEVPEGTAVTWKVNTANAKLANIAFSSVPNSVIVMQQTDNQWFVHTKVVRDAEQYSISLKNDFSLNRDNISYAIQVIKDRYPEIAVDQMRDSLLYSNVMLAGLVKDDYEVTALEVYYEILKDVNSIAGNKKFEIPISPNQQGQNFFYRWSLDSLQLEPGDQLNYYLQVWDNDGVNGRKATKSARYQFMLPTQVELEAEITKSQVAAENKIDQSLNKAKSLRESIEEAQQKLKGKQNLDWQDKKMLEDLIEQKKSLDNIIQDLQKENEMLQQKKDAFSPESERLKEKSEQIQKLMNELLDEETKKLFQELEKLLKENADQSQMQKLLDKMDRKEINLEKELERTLELFKQLQYDHKLERAIEQLKEQTQKQEELLQKTDSLAQDKDNRKADKPQPDSKSDEKAKENSAEEQNQGDQESDLAQQQEELKEEFEQFEQAVKELEKLGEEIDEPGETPSEQQMNEVQQSQEESQKSLEQGDNQKAKESQKKSISKMKEMQQQMESMQNAMEMEIDMENLESLRQIIHGLIKLSFDQEGVMKDFGAIQQTDPRYINLSQLQLKLKDDAKVLEDSLLALGKRDPFMGSVVTREVGELNEHIDKTMEHLRERRKSNASNEMQLAMTSINNLALMLNDHFDMMMEMMANAKPSKGKKKGKQQSLGEMQMKLNQQMEEIRRGGKTGRQLSEEMAKMAAEQERIRRALQEMQEKLKQEGGKPLGNDIPGQMEQTEIDLVNKQLTEQTLRRQREILTRLLEAEKSMREQNLDEERKGETAKDYQKEIPRAFEEYLRLKEKEVELLKTVPPKLYPYYKKEVGEYFKRIETETQN